MQLVGDKKLFARLAVGAEHDVVGLAVLQVRLASNVVLYQPVQRLLLVGLLPAGDAGAERDKNNLRVGQLAVDLGHKVLEFAKDLFDRLTSVQIVATSTQENR